MAAKQGSIKFSDIHGFNIEVNRCRRKAAWGLKHQAGYCFLNSHLNKNDRVIFLISGSGHVRLGFTCSNPAQSGFDPKNDLHSKSFRLRQKKKTSIISVSRDGVRIILKEKGNNIGPLEWQVEDHVDVVLFVDIMFGDLTVDIDQEKSKPKSIFDNLHGDNISLAVHNTRARLQHPNPSALCATDRSIVQGEIITLDIKPLPDTNWTYTKVFLSNYSAHELELDSIDTCVKKTATMKLVPIDLKVRSIGVVQLRLEKDQVCYSYLMKESKLRLKELDVSKPLYVFAELFRMRMKIWSAIPRTSVSPYLRADSTIMESPVSSFDTSQPGLEVQTSDASNESIARRSPVLQASVVPHPNHQAAGQNEAAGTVAPHADPDLTVQKVSIDEAEQTLPKQML